MSGLSPDLEIIAEGMIGAAMGLATDVMRGARDTAIAVSHELAGQKGMAGDDEAGQEFSKVYNSAAATTLDQLGFSSYLLGESGMGLMRNAREFMAEESRQIAAFLGKQTDLTTGMGDPGAGCPENYLNLGQELPEVVGETSWFDQYGSRDRFRGSPDKLRTVSETWQRAATLMLRFLEDAQAYASTADKAHSGEAADAFREYFKYSVGLTCPPTKAQDDEPLVTNLVAACNQLAKACDRYAEHVEEANKKIQAHKAEFLAVDMPWDDPRFGGNGFDGGLRDAVLEDPWIRQLGEVASALDASQARVKLPQGSEEPPGFSIPVLPFPIRVPIPVPLVLASYTSGAPGIVPALYRDPDSLVTWRDPIPPAQPSVPLTPAQRIQFDAWVNTLRPLGFGGKSTDPNHPENAYQLRIAGYPERLISLPADFEKAAISADGIRPVDGYMVDAKYVENSDDDCKKNTWRTPSTFELEDRYDDNGKKKWSKKDVLVGKDTAELEKYRQAMIEHDEIRGLEIDTNSEDSAAYWQTLMALKQVKGDSRYVP